MLPDGTFAGRTALVTGAGTGIGRASALRLVELGASVIGVGRRVELLRETRAMAANPERLRIVPQDIRDRAATSELVRGLGTLDLVVNNAGGQFIAPAADLSPRGFGAVLDLNLTATAAVTEAAHAGLAAVGGRVVTLSISAAERGIAGMVHSAAARAAMAALVADLGERWAADGVRLFCLAPGTVLTAGVGDELAGSTLQAAVDASILGRDTSAAEVAEWVAALGSGLFDAVSGTVIEIDAGAALVDASSVLVGTEGVDRHG
ncbi:MULTISPECIES: SDR family oxidoreductase [unclassified Nocardioides]|uniref:SDR family oxidoreductase n=1 Tax=unclassified Nocardioides TaxID=2615069 RepID=UPI0036121868